jgi:ribosomal-protein-alanine N-acetyltransferase
VIIETERLLLRPFDEGDLAELTRLRSDPEVMRYIGGGLMQSPEAIARRFRFYMDCYARHGFSMMPAIRKSDKAFVGWGGLQPLEETGEIEVGYGFDKPFWGHGYATELAAAWLRYGFEEAGLPRIVAVAIPENTASRRVMEKLGMKYEKNATHYNNDCVFYSIAREEFEPRDGSYALHASADRSDFGI